MVVRYWETRLPAIQSIIFYNAAENVIFSVKAWLQLVNLAGEVTLGRRLAKEV